MKKLVVISENPCHLYNNDSLYYRADGRSHAAASNQGTSYSVQHAAAAPHHGCVMMKEGGTRGGGGGREANDACSPAGVTGGKRTAA